MNQVSDGVNFFISFSQLNMSVVGQTTSALNVPLFLYNDAKMIMPLPSFPKPISSARNAAPVTSLR
jgi:hypothetical protein